MLAAGPSGGRVLLARALHARDALPDMLRAAGAVVDVVPLYETLPVTRTMPADYGANPGGLMESLAREPVHCITFASSSTVRHFFAAVDASELHRRQQVQGLRFACIGPVTARTLHEYGFSCDIQPAHYTIPALIEAVSAFFSSEGPPEKTAFRGEA
jgi:uroporphyrinogen III methyltransferase/synthase